jgi:hypothetical protein
MWPGEHMNLRSRYRQQRQKNGHHQVAAPAQNKSKEQCKRTADDCSGK